MTEEEIQKALIEEYAKLIGISIDRGDEWGIVSAVDWESGPDPIAHLTLSEDGTLYGALEESFDEEGMVQVNVERIAVAILKCEPLYPIG